MLRLEPAVQRIRHYDAWLCVRMNRALGYNLVACVFRMVSWLGNGIFWYALMLTLLLQHRSSAVLPVLHMVFVGVVCTGAYRMLKGGTLRPRPYQALEGIAVGAAPLDRFSFPSGHTLHAVGFSIVASSHYPALLAPLVLFTLLTAASRVVLGLHYPSDVVAGAAIGGLVAGISLGI